LIHADANGNVELHYDGSKKLQTTSTGIDVIGHIKETTKPIFRAYKTGTQLFPNGTNTKVTFGVESFDVGSNYSTSNSRFTAPVAGYYQFDVNVRFTITSPGRCDILLAKNGGFDVSFPSGGQNQTGSNDGGMGVHGVMYLAANDYVEVYANQNSGSDSSLSSSSNISNTGGITNFSGFLITAA